MCENNLVRVCPDSAIGVASRNISILSKHRQELLDELSVIDFGVDAEADEIVRNAYGQLDLAILCAIHREAERAINIQSSR